MDSVATHVGLPGLINDDLKSTLLELISEGNKIKAIKEYRSATGAGLLEAKQFIDHLSE
ncbi:ribosomal protein L7/L12 [Carnobacterium jeotgali]|uniref:ribosomal protein L7/L12 n=1 Tax=Carnobacterium jeotgali TaxID=545534 RepID=UPI0009DF4295